MAIGWLAVLQLVPWADVIRNAPKVADEAKKLWSAVKKKPEATKSPSTNVHSAHLPEEQSFASLQAQITALEATASDLQDQMLASSELIQALADQNTQLIKRIEANRIRILWLAGAVVVLGIIAVARLAITLLRDAV